MSLTQSKPTRNADLRHAQSLGRQRKATSIASPGEQAASIAAVVRKRIADGQPVPDLDRYRLDNATWTELLDALDADELSAVADACGADGLDDSDDSDDEPSADDVTMAFGDMPLMPEPPTPQQTPHVAHGWRDHEPPIVHSLKWRDSDGIEHLHVVRTDDLDEALRHILKVKLCIKAAQLKAQKACDLAPTPTPDGRLDWCRVHNTAMKQRGDESKGYWHSHKAADGSWCRGKDKL
jgi:hypothetical protein